MNHFGEKKLQTMNTCHCDWVALKGEYSFSGAFVSVSFLKIKVAQGEEIKGRGGWVGNIVQGCKKNKKQNILYATKLHNYFRVFWQLVDWYFIWWLKYTKPSGLI